LCFDDVGHTSGNANLHFIGQATVIQAGDAQNQACTFQFKRFERIQDGRTCSSQLNPLGVKADNRRVNVVFRQQFKVGCNQFLLWRRFGFAYAVACNENDGFGIGLFIFIFCEMFFVV